MKTTKPSSLFLQFFLTCLVIKFMLCDKIITLSSGKENIHKPLVDSFL